MKLIRHLSLLILVIIMVSCNKQNEPELKPIEKIEIQTDKNSYQLTEKITFKIENNTSRELIYYACQYQSDPNVAIQKENNDFWEVIQYSACPEYTWIPLKENGIKKDTINPNLNEVGIYRLGIMFIDNHKDTLIYSNNFEIIE